MIRGHAPSAGHERNAMGSLGAAREFTAHTKFYNSPAHGSVLEVDLAGPASLDGSTRLSNTLKEEDRKSVV